jgi:hypothetical protein
MLSSGDLGRMTRTKRKQTPLDVWGLAQPTSQAKI